MTPAGRVVRLEHFERPETMNDYRKMHYHVARRVDSRWRTTFAQLALTARPRARFERVTICVSPICRQGTTLPDVGACFPVVKAAIDGLVDARVIPNDTPEHLQALTFFPPRHGDRDSLVLTIEEQP